MIRLRECDVDEFSELIIEEEDNVYLAKLLDSNDGEFSIRYNKDQINHVLDLIYVFLQMENICMISGMIPVIREMNRKPYMEVLGLGGRKLRLHLFDCEFKTIYRVIGNKYFNDRDEFFKNSMDNINHINLDAKYRKYMYKVSDDSVDITLATDNNGNVIGSEIEFVIKYLYDKFASIGKEVSVIEFRDAKGINNGWIVKCGSFVLTCPKGYTYSPLLAKINEYNNNIKGRKKR
jgi:hypothetical protein